MRIAAVLAGFTMGQSDVLRKAMGKKDPKVMAKQREAFMTGAREKGINEKKAKKIFDLMEFFAGYGFNKSHSTTYAWVAYQTAYLKANYPSHFMAALLTIEAANTDKLAMYLGECRDLGIPILPPDINTSQLAFTVETDGTALSASGSCAVKNVGEGAILSMLGVRQGAWAASIRSSPVRGSRPASGEQARRSKACQGRRVRSLGRRVPVAVTPRPPVRRGRQGDRARQPAPARTATKGMVSLFDCARRRRAGHGDSAAGASRRGPRRSSWRSRRKSLGLYMSGHPLERFSEELKTFGAQRVAELAASLRRRLGRRHRQRPAPAEDQEGRPHGGLHARRHRRRRRSRGLPGDVRQARHHSSPRDAMLLVRGKFEKDDESARHRRHRAAADLAAQGADDARGGRSTCRCRTRNTMEALAELLSRHRGDRRVLLELDVKRNGGAGLRVRADVAQRVRPSEKLVEEVEQLCGAGSVRIAITVCRQETSERSS